MRGRSLASKLAWILVFVAGMAYVESAVVVYLREIANPAGTMFPIVIIPRPLAAIEIGREAATIFMLVALGALSGSDVWERFLLFCAAFAAWDILYYAWLKVFIGWPESLLTWDILFLIPVPWVAPVVAPVIVATTILAGTGVLLRMKSRGAVLAFPAWLWAIAIAGGLVDILSFTLDFRSAFTGPEPAPFRWGLFALGWGMGAAALALGTRRIARGE
ncbi:MAG: hypothetical protein HY049_07805 [Acidobacteria bacterium]|nr:hypothetical protein [Acidobacteriota bacterium]